MHDASAQMEDRARAVLRVLFDAPTGEGLTELLSDPNRCPNCGSETRSARSPYCSDFCRQAAAFVRQLRTAMQSGGPSQDRQMMFGQAFWHLIGGGRPLRVSIAPASAIKQVFKRTDGKCETCGAPATTVDNVGSG